MNKHIVKGKTKQILGAGQQKAGKVLKDRSMQVKVAIDDYGGARSLTVSKARLNPMLSPTRSSKGRWASGACVACRPGRPPC